MSERKILIVGNGGREHALLWALARGEPYARFFITRGNGGTDPLATALPFDPTDIHGLAGWAEAEGVDLTVVGPEAPLDAGIVDHFAERGLPAFGPTRSAARIESSKAFAKHLMRDAHVPTADFRVFRDADEATAYIRELGGPAVVKASGLAGGKGAVVCDTVEEAQEAARSMLASDTFGAAGREVVVEERMEGEELSLFVFSDGRHVVPLLATQDHKRIGEGDRGANTGGMGAYGPVSIATPDLIDAALERIVHPTLAALRDRNAPYRGLLYAGLMLTTDGPRVVEFNCRFGDPETQALIPLLTDPIGPIMGEIARGGSVEGIHVDTRSGATLTTVLASEGYPGAYPRGRPIDLGTVEDEPDVFVFHAGTARENGRLVTSGGRVLAVTALGTTVAEAAERSRAAAEGIRFEGRYFRRDIGWREIEREGA